MEYNYKHCDKCRGVTLDCYADEKGHYDRWRIEEEDFTPSNQTGEHLQIYDKWTRLLLGAVADIAEETQLTTIATDATGEEMNAELTFNRPTTGQEWTALPAELINTICKRWKLAELATRTDGREIRFYISATLKTK